MRPPSPRQAHGLQVL
uniref:Uncharacterized protein n=1 Tax=Vitis vinifera TaxID=29760 RepID=F6HD79_VITVI